MGYGLGRGLSPLRRNLFTFLRLEVVYSSAFLCTMRVAAETLKLSKFAWHFSCGVHLHPYTPSVYACTARPAID